MGVAFTFGVSLGITNLRARTGARVAAFVPPVATFIMLRPASFAKQTAIQLSTSQWIGLLTACLVAYFYAQFWETARKSPKLAMSLESLGDIKPAGIDAPRRKKKKDEDEEEEEDEEIEEAEAKKERPAPETV